MQSILFHSQNWLEELPGKCIDRKWAILLLVVFSTFVCMWGLATRLSIDMSPEAWFQDGAEPVVIRDMFRSQFGSDEDVFIAYRPKSGDVFSPDAMATLKDLHQELEEAMYSATAPSGDPSVLSRIIRVDSLYNARYQIADGDTLISNTLIGSNFPIEERDLEAKRKIAESQNNFRQFYFSNDYTTGGIRIKTNLGTLSHAEPSAQNATESLLEEDILSFDSQGLVSAPANPEENKVIFTEEQVENYVKVVKSIRTILNQPKYSNFEYHLAGTPTYMEFSMDSIKQATGLIALMIVIIIIMSWLSFKSFSAIVWPLLIVSISLTSAMGIGSWFSLSYTAILVITALLSIAVGVASCIHILNVYTLLRKQGLHHRNALAMGYRRTGVPIILTTITTMIGMLAMTLTGMPIMQVFGIVSALAVLISLLLVLFLLPILLTAWHPDPNSKLTNEPKIVNFFSLEGILEYLTTFTEKHSKLIVVNPWCI